MGARAQACGAERRGWDWERLHVARASQPSSREREWTRQVRSGKYLRSARMSDTVGHTREPCPDRILDDIGGAFAMGVGGGTIWHFFKGLRNSPRGARLLGAIDAVKISAPALGSSFAVWGGLFSTFDCALVGLRGKEDPWNAIASGAITGGVLSIRAGPAAAAKSAVIGGVFLALIEGVGIAMTRMTADLGPNPEEIQRMQQEMAELQKKQQRERDAAAAAAADGQGEFAFSWQK